MKPNDSLLYIPTNPIVVKANPGSYSHMRFEIHGDDWEMTSVSLNRGSFIVGKLNDPKEGLYGSKLKVVKKLKPDMGVRAVRWCKNLTTVVSVHTVEDYMGFWNRILQTVQPQTFGPTKERAIGVGNLNGSPMLMMHKNKNHVLVSPSSLVHLEWTCQGSGIKQRHIYVDDNGHLSVPLAYVLKAMDQDFGRFCDPFDKNPNKTLQSENRQHLLTFHFEETFKEE